MRVECDGWPDVYVPDATHAGNSFVMKDGGRAVPAAGRMDQTARIDGRPIPVAGVISVVRIPATVAAGA